MGPERFELSTPRLSVVCSLALSKANVTVLSYGPDVFSCRTGTRIKTYAELSSDPSPTDYLLSSSHSMT